MKHKRFIVTVMILAVSIFALVYFFASQQTKVIVESIIPMEIAEHPGYFAHEMHYTFTLRNTGKKSTSIDTIRYRIVPKDGRTPIEGETDAFFPKVLEPQQQAYGHVVMPMHAGESYQDAHCKIFLTASPYQGQAFDYVEVDQGAVLIAYSPEPDIIDFSLPDDYQRNPKDNMYCALTVAAEDEHPRGESQGRPGLAFYFFQTKISALNVPKPNHTNILPIPHETERYSILDGGAGIVISMYVDIADQ